MNHMSRYRWFVKLALETDWSRLFSVFIDTTVIHNIPHHCNRPEVLAELRSGESEDELRQVIEHQRAESAPARGGSTSSCSCAGGR